MSFSNHACKHYTFKVYKLHNMLIIYKHFYLPITAKIFSRPNSLPPKFHQLSVYLKISPTVWFYHGVGLDFGEGQWPRGEEEKKFWYWEDLPEI